MTHRAGMHPYEGRIVQEVLNVVPQHGEVPIDFLPLQGGEAAPAVWVSNLSGEDKVIVQNDGFVVTIVHPVIDDKLKLLAVVVYVGGDRKSRNITVLTVLTQRNNKSSTITPGCRNTLPSSLSTYSPPRHDV